MSHHSIQIVLTVYLAVGALVYVLLIGQPREPNSPFGAALQMIVTALLLWAVWSL